MKSKVKFALALSALTLAMASAHAQSSVNLSGVIDLGLEKVDSNAATSMASGRNATSNITFSGSEDLGGGLKANFKVSTAFDASSGSLTNNDAFGNNDMFLELAGGFGSVKAGRSFNPVVTHALTANGTKGVTGYATLGGALDNMGMWVPNQIVYTSPTWEGLTATLSYAPSEVAGAKNHTGFGLKYQRGAFTATFASANEFLAPNAAPNLTTSGAFKDKNVHQLGAAYDFGVAKTFFTFQKDGNNAGNADTAYSLGVTAPVGPGSLWASYDVKELAGADGKVTQVGYKYNLSKRTVAYASIGHKNDAMAGGNSTTGYGFGLQHSF